MNPKLLILLGCLFAVEALEVRSISHAGPNGHVFLTEYEENGKINGRCSYSDGKKALEVTFTGKCPTTEAVVA